MSIQNENNDSQKIDSRIDQVEDILLQFGVRSDLVESLKEESGSIDGDDSDDIKVNYSREFEDLFGFYTDALAILEPKTTTILKTNSAFTDLTGMLPENLVGSRVGDMARYTGHSFEQVSENIEKAAVDGYNNFELLARDILLNTFNAQVRLKPIFLEGKTYILNAVIDQSKESVLRHRLVALQNERRELENAKLMYARLSYIANAVPLALWSCDVSGSITFCNSRFLEITGLGEHNCDLWQELIHPEDQSAFRREWTRSMNTGATIEYEFRMARMPARKLKQVDYHWYQLKALSTRDENGKVCEWIGSLNEIVRTSF